MMRTEASFSVAFAILLLIYVTDDVHGAGFSGAPVARPKPCLVTPNGEINQTSYQALQASGTLDDGVNNALTCSKLSPSQYCSSIRDGWLCVLQKTNAGQCFAPLGTAQSLTGANVPPATTQKPPAATAPPPLSRIQFEDQVLNASIAARCPPELVEKRANLLGQVQCSALLRMANGNPVAAKTYLLGLNVFWGVMPCLVQLIRMNTLALTAAEKATIANAPGLPIQVANDLKQMATPPATTAGSTGFAQLGLTTDDIVQAVSKAGSRASGAAIVKSYVTAAITKEKQSERSKLGDDLAGLATKTAKSRRPTPGTYSVVDTLRPMNTATTDAVGIVMTDSSVFGCFGDKEIGSIPANVSCRPVDTSGTDPYVNLTDLQQRTMRDNCRPFLGANLPPTLRSAATPSEIRSECNATTYAQLDSYIEAFSNNADKLTADQVSSLQSCCDALHKPNNYTTLSATGRILKLRSCICHVPVAIVSSVLKTQADIDNYCQAMADSTSYCKQAPDILHFCLQYSTLDIGDLGNLARALSATDVNALAVTSVVQNIAKLSRVVINKLARQALLAVYVQYKNGLTALTDADFQALGSLVTEFSATDFATIQSNPAVKAFFNLAAPSIQQELSDQAQRASSGTIPPAAAADISTAAANVAAVQTSDTTSSARRRKRGTTPPPLIGCTGLQNLGPSVAAADLSNLNVSVFNTCPSLLNADNLSFPQLQLIASQAVMALGDPLNGAACRSPTLWTGPIIQQLGVVVLALNATTAKAGSPTQMSCLNFAWMNNSLTVSSYTAVFGMPPPPLPQLQAVFNTWSSQTAFRGPLTAATATLLGYINCGAPDSVLQAMTLAEVDKAVKMFGGLSCFTMSALQILANDTMALYATSGTPPSLSVSTISNVGTIIAGMSPNFFQTLNADQIGAITPKAISLIPPQIIASLTLTQINALTAPQCVALRDNQLAVLTSAALNSVMQKVNSTSPSGGSSPPGGTAPPKGTAPPMVPGGTPPPQPPPQGSDLPPKMGDATMGPPGGGGPFPPLGNGSMPEGMNGSFPGGIPGGIPGGSPGDFNGTFPGGPPVGPSGSNGTFPGGVPPFGGGNSTGQGGLPGGVPGGLPGFPGVTGMPNTGGGGTSINLQEVVNSYNPPAALPPMTADNAYMYANKIADAAPADIAQKLPVAALASPAVLKELTAVADSMTPTQLQTIQSQMMKVMPATALGQNFNPSLLADAASFLSDQLVKSLSPDQALKVIQQPSFNAKDPDAVAMFGQQAAAALSSITDRSTLVTTLEKSSKVMPGIPPSNFKTIIDGTKCDDSFLAAFKNATLNPQQALLLFSKYQSDSPTDLTKMPSGDVVSFVTNLPPALIQAVTADSLTSVSSAPTSVLPLMSAISSSRQNSSAFDRTAEDDGPTPALNRLYEKLDKTSLSTSDLKTLANAGALRIDAIKASGDQLCSVATSATPVPLEPEEAKALYAKCSAGIGAIFTGTGDKYGRLSVAAPPADINSTTDDASFMANIHNFCEGSIWFGDRQQLRVIVGKVQAHIDAKNDLSSILANISCILPYLGSKYLSTITDPSKQLLACRMMACANCEQAEVSLIREDINFCISSGVTLGNLSCSQSDRGNCLLNMINAEQIAKFSCPSIKASVDVVTPHVINCSARDAIFNCIKPLMDLTESTNVSLIGPLLDRFTLADWTAASNAKVLCSRIKAVVGSFDEWRNFIDARTALGLTSPPICDNHAAVLSNLTQAALSADCKQVSTTKRKRRDTTSTALTCSVVNSMGSSVTSLSVSSLSTITAADFPNCAYNLGRIRGFSAEQWQALANIAKTAYNGDLSQWTAVQIRTAAGIVTGLPAQNIANLKLNTLEAIDAIGNYGSWLSDKVVGAFGSLLTNYKNNNITALTAAELQSMGELVCGATASQIQSILPDRFCGAIQDIGKTETCEASQLQAWIGLAKSSNCLGSDVKQWSAGDIQSLGAVIGGLAQTDLGLLTSTQIASITERSLPFIPPAQFNGFSLAQLKYFTTTQLAVMTTAQYQSLDSNKQQYVVNALTSVGSELLKNPTVKGDGQKNAGHQLIGSISIPLLAAAAAAVLLIKM